MIRLCEDRYTYRDWERQGLVDGRDLERQGLGETGKSSGKWDQEIELIEKRGTTSNEIHYSG